MHLLPYLFVIISSSLFSTMKFVSILLSRGNFNNECPILDPIKLIRQNSVNIICKKIFFSEHSYMSICWLHSDIQVWLFKILIPSRRCSWTDIYIYIYILFFFPLACMNINYTVHTHGFTMQETKCIVHGLTITLFIKKY